MKIEHIYIVGGRHDLYLARCCVASIRRWYPDIPVSLLKDETSGAYSTGELEQAWNVGVFESDQPRLGMGWAKLEPMFQPGRQRCLVIDSDMVFLGPVLGPLEALDTDFIVESQGGRPEPLSRRPNWLKEDYFDLAKLYKLDPTYVYPGYTFNAGQIVATSGILQRGDFEPYVTLGPRSVKLQGAVFGAGRDQGIFNYVLTKKAQRGELTIGRVPFMQWGYHRSLRSGLPRVRVGDLTDSSPHTFVLHWAGPKTKLFCLMRNGWLLRHFEAEYYSRIPGGRRKRLWGSALALWELSKRSGRRRARSVIRTGWPKLARISLFQD